MFIIAKYNSYCAETGRSIKKYDSIYWSKSSRKVYCSASKKYQEEKDALNTKLYIQAQEDAYFDKWSSTNL